MPNGRRHVGKNHFMFDKSKVPVLRVIFFNSLFKNFECDGEDITFKLNQLEFIQTIKQLSIIPIHLKSSLLIEFNDIFIVGGGGGCLQIEGPLPIEKYNQIITEFLEVMKIEIPHNLNELKNYQLLLLNPNSKLIIITENG